MRKFNWPLQKLLDVTDKREQAMRSAMHRLSRDLSEVRRTRANRQARLQRMMDYLGQCDPQQRVTAQETFLKHCDTWRRELDELSARLADLERQRAAKIEELVAARNKRQSLERLADQARREHARDQDRQEQKVLDENAQVSYTPKASAGPAGGR